MLRGAEAERLAIYFEELGAYQHKQNQNHQNNTPSSSSNEITEQVFEDQEADVYIPDDDFIEEG